MEDKLLIIIDPQNDFTSVSGLYAGKHPVTSIQATIGRINALLGKLKVNQILVVLSDYRPGQFEPGIDMCIPNTYGHQIDNHLKVDSSFNYIVKTNHSAFTSREFTVFLEKNAIHTLVLTGFLAEYCVKQTALDALQRGLAVELVEDCISTGDDVYERKNTTFDELKRAGAKVIQGSDVF